MNIRIYEVGGSIRNELIGRKSSDKDFAVIAPDYDTMRQHLLNRGAIIYQERPEYVSIKAKLLPIGAVDFTLARKESFYTDARHPDSVSPANTIEEDFSRRDFRMNAIAREEGTSELIDPFNGLKDISEKCIRSVGNAIDRFKEDRLRIFRSIRFACQLGFTIDLEVSNAIDNFQNLNDFKSVSGEMIQIELYKSFRANWQQALQILNLHPFLFTIIQDKDIWLKPTLESK